MKQCVLRVILCATTLVAYSAVRADSPLTSTEISRAYQDVGIVKAAANSGGLLTPKLMKYLAHPRKPIDIKMAVINQLGWDINGKNNAELFFNYLNPAGKYPDMAAWMQGASGDLLICMAYLKGLDNYFDVADAAVMARKAKAKSGPSYTVHIICALIEAQYAFDSDWCEVYQLTDRVRQNTALRQDMRPVAVDIIFEYMDLYEESCAGLLPEREAPIRWGGMGMETRLPEAVG